jgi:hypothetical protein
MVFWSADVEVSGDNLSALVTHGHVSFGSPSTRLLSLYDYSHSLQTRRASRLTTSSGNETPARWGTTSTLKALHKDTYVEKRSLV